METNRKCEECGAEFPANAPQGLCPQCLARMGLSLVPTLELPKSNIVIERTGTMIGRYKLLEKIGEGGFGVVYMAEQVEPVQRKVALKIIKAGMDTKEVIARFEAERQAIALMDHPNIARALDAGATQAGRPYFVMELVRGIAITDYCDQANLPTRERLQLFVKVCQAVQHAHQKGVIHRDLKPSNVLVTEHDGEPVPKVIDFGVAKALGQKLTEKTLFTGFQHMIGTPAYMSPEQAALSGLDIDTRADIYSLGVLLYELLTGATPFDADTFRKAALDEIRRMIRETEPPRPSTRLRTLGEKLSEVAKRRHTEPAALDRLIRGDLDWIVMKTLEKDRTRRYETANELARDIERHLNSEPVVARAPGNLYRFQKLVFRHKLGFAAAGAVTATLLIGLGVSTWSLFREKEARRRAVVAETIQSQLRQQAEVEKKNAQIEANRSQQVAHYLKNMLDDIAPSLAKKCTKPYVLEVLTRVDERVGLELKNQPDLEAVVRTVLADVQGDMGQYDNAETNLNKVVEMRKRLFGNQSSEVAVSLGKLADLLYAEGKRAEAEGFAKESISILEHLVQGDPTREEYRGELGHSQWRLGDALAETGQRETAIQVISNALQVFEKAAHDFPGSQYFRREQAVSHRKLGDLLPELGQVDEIERHYRMAIGLYGTLKKDAPDNAFYPAEEARIAWLLATKLERAGRIDAAAAEYRQAVALQDLRVPLREASGLAGSLTATNLLFNGSFELPACAGHGHTFSTEKSFDLPGWEFSTGDLQFILEYGEPQNRARYADGRQAVSLNGDGCQPPVMLAQTFATTPGESYTLSFAQGDEEMAGPSTSELTVSVADERRVFSREHDNGMVFKFLHFTARSNLTTLQFLDTSPSKPDIVHSPFLDAVSVVAGSLETPVGNPATNKLGCPYPAELLVSRGGKATWSPGSDRIAFTKLGGGLAILELQSRRISDLTSQGNDPAWSPDGYWVAYVTSSGAAYYSEEVWIVPATGGQPVNIGHGGFPCWSADGRQVLFQDRKTGRILAARVDARNEAPSVFHEHTSSWYPAISPDGDQIAFGARDQMIVVERKTGETLAKLAAPGERGFLPAWSPDGRQVGFGGFAGSQAGLWICDVQRGGAFQVAKNGKCTMPAWSPDGKRLVFDYRGDPNEIWMIETTNLPGRPVLVSQLPSRTPARQADTETKPTAMAFVGKSMPRGFKLPLLTGGEIDLPPSTNHGPLLLDFCATWCGPCRQAMPVLAGIAKDYSARGVRYVAVNQGETPETIRNYLARAKLEMCVALDKKCGMAGAFRVEGIPTIVIVDRSNIIRDVHVGTSPKLGDELRTVLDKMLREQAEQGKSPENDSKPEK